MSVSLYGSGQTVIQVVSQTFSGTQITTTSNSMVATGLGLSITPQSTTSKILVSVTASIGSSSQGMGLSIARNTSIIWNPAVADASGYYGIGAGSSVLLYSLINLQYLDSPATTSSTTYNLYFASRSGGTSYLNLTAGTNNGGTTITLMEISGA